MEALKKVGISKIFEDKISGVKSEKPNLTKLLEFIRKDDTLVVWRLDRLGRSTIG
ncbi:recombinase family protein [Chryseobacterium camelliae]|uniref:recombinase family protein n=1 Tax=Chryseobacterium camelliae TaxID=1265445 RepID=UPI00202B12AA